MSRRTILTQGSASLGVPTSHTNLLFVYGANLSPAVLRKRGVWPVQRAVPAVAPATAVLSFCHRGGFATIELEDQTTSNTAYVSHTADAAGSSAARQSGVAAPAPRRASEPCSIVQPHGMLYSLSDAELARLAKRETGYRLAVMPVTPYGVEDSVAAHVFMSQRMLRLRKPLPPTQRYLHLMLSGARSWQLSEKYIQRLGRVPTARPGGLPGEYFDTPSASVAAAVVLCAVVAAACM